MDINLHNKNLIYKIFPKLDDNHKILIISSINKICEELKKHIFFNLDTSTFEAQMKLNNSKDILGFVILLLPYFDFFKCYEIKSLDDIFKDTPNSQKVFSENNFQSTYYLDHKIDDYENYFRNNTEKIINTIIKVKHKLQVNWINIFPYKYGKTTDIEDNEIYKNLSSLYIEKKINVENELKIGYDTLFGTISNFLYNDIFPIKWMIYDININNSLIPNIIYVADLLKIHNILIEDYDTSEKINSSSVFRKLSQNRQKELEENWNEVIKEDINKNRLQNLILFYLRYENDKDKLDEIIKTNKCRKIIKTNFEDEIIEETDDIDNISVNIRNCIYEVIGNLKFENIYNYLFSCLQQFRYTWYGFMCIEDTKIIHSIEKYRQALITYFRDENNSIKKDDPFYDKRITYTILMSLKIYYNYFKSLLHVSYADEDGNMKYIKLGKTWDELHEDNKNIFISKINDNDIRNSWFNIPNNIRRNFPTIPDAQIQIVMGRLRDYIYKKTFIPKIIISTLLYNGILTEFKFNPKITDTTQIPDKKKDFLKWKQTIINNLSIEEYENNSYSFLSNTIYSKIPNSIKDIKDSFWYTNFGGDWVAQIQLYHHFINQRLIITTAATGAGKSTVVPFIFLYALKILNYNNNGKVFCTQPRIQPTESNITRISESLGYKYNYFIDNNKKKLKKNIITYIQYKHQKDETVDDYYHPTLRMLTDGALYAQITNNFLFKTSIKSEKEEKNRRNLFDILLVDEAHEHNTNMDMLLTLSRYNIYINNQITLGIISATIDYDEPIYRKYFKNIDDNLKFPLKITEITNNLDSNLIDRRLHLGAPFTGTNFPIKEIPREGEETLTILNEIFKTSTKGDILIFKSGQSEIKQLITEINNMAPKDVLAIPFYSEIPDDKLEIIKNISNKEVRNNFRYPKNYTIMDDILEKDLLPKGYYKRFVIVATNIAEASITIDTLEYVIDDGNQKTNYYDYITKTYNLKTTKISKPSRLQRRGRVGRVKPGIVYYTYDISNQSDKVIYKLSIENISTIITNLISNSTSTTINKKINKNNDPNIINNDLTRGVDFLEKLNLLPEDIKLQYTLNLLDEYNIRNNTSDYAKYSYLWLLFFLKNEGTINFKKVINIEDVFYSDDDGKYDLEDVLDKKGKFFIISPDEDIFIRDKELSILNIEKENNKEYIIELDKKNNYEIVKKDGKVIIIKEYNNKIELITNYLQNIGILNELSKLSNMGKLVQEINKLFMDFPKKIESIICILDLIKNYEDIDYHYILLLIIYMEGGQYKFSNEITKIIRNNKSDILNIAETFSKKEIYNKLKFEDFLNDIKDDNFNIEKLIINKTSDVIDDFFKNNTLYFKDDINTIKMFVSRYNLLKIIINIIRYIFYFKKNCLVLEKRKEYFEKIKVKLLNEDEKKIYENYKECLKKQNDIKFFNPDYVNINKNNELYIYDDYEKMCYFAVKYYNSNLLVNIPKTPFYYNYRNPDINIIYEISKNIKGTKHYTSVEKYYRQNYILYCSSNDSYMLQTITYIPYKIINKYIEENKIKIKKNIDKINLENIKKNNIENFNEIIKKIDIINKYYNSL